jgi:hypothetical protein
MVSKRSGEASPESIARAHRLKVAADEGKRAMVDVERQATAVRQNMARLRSLREAEEARRLEEKQNEPDLPIAKKKRKKAAPSSAL